MAWIAHLKANIEAERGSRVQQEMELTWIRQQEIYRERIWRENAARLKNRVGAANQVG